MTMKAEDAITLGRTLQLVETLDEAAFNLANHSMHGIATIEPGGYLVTLEATAILNRIRGLNGEAFVTVGRETFGYSLGGHPLSAAGQALESMLSSAWEPIG